MRVDVSIVLHRLSIDTFARSLDALAAAGEAIASVRILLSGSDRDAAALAEAIAARSGAERFRVRHRYDNLGFATGHNLLIEDAFAEDAAGVLVLNPDVVFTARALAEFLAAVSQRAQPALFGPSMRRRNPDATPGSAREADSMGVRWTLTARHYDIGQGGPWATTPGAVDRVQGITGACVLVTREAHAALTAGGGHVFDDLFLAYREDAELGVRADAIGVPSFIVHVDGFEHVRASRGFERGSALIDLLGVRNRFLIRWALGRRRPGNPVLGAARDLMVAVAACTVERSSTVGLREAFRIRRYVRARSRPRRPSGSGRSGSGR